MRSNIMKLDELLSTITAQWKRQIFNINIRVAHLINGKSMNPIQANALIKEYETLYSHFVKLTYDSTSSCQERVLRADVESYLHTLKKEAIHAIGVINAYCNTNTIRQNNATLPQPSEPRVAPPVQKHRISLTQTKSSTSRTQEHISSQGQKYYFFQPTQSTNPVLLDNLSQPIPLTPKTVPAVPMPTFEEQYEAGEIFPHDPDKYPQYYICNF